MTLLGILVIIAGIVLLIFITGLFLPKERVVSRKGHFNVPPEVLYEIVTDNKNWQYRTSLKDLVILENNNGFEVWDEITKEGAVIRFTTTEKHPFSFYSFNMESKMFTGHWTGEFTNDGKGGTIFTATEYIRVKNPLIKALSYISFNIGKLMDDYQHDLQQKVNKL